jgi:hypothetical protein
MTKKKKNETFLIIHSITVPVTLNGNDVYMHLPIELWMHKTGFHNIGLFIQEMFGECWMDP